MFAQCRVHGVVVKTLLDTGANVNIIENNFRKKIGVKIDALAEDHIINGIGSGRPLGLIKDLPVTFGKVTIEGDMLVCNRSMMKHQDLLLGVPWLHDAGMRLDFIKKEVRFINRKGREQLIPIQIFEDPDFNRDEESVACFIAQSDINLDSLNSLPLIDETVEHETENDDNKKKIEHVLDAEKNSPSLQF